MNKNIFIRNFLELIKRNALKMFFITALSVATMIGVSQMIPKTYRAEFEINIYSKYFKNALISEVISGMNSGGEMTETVDSMIKEVINDELIDEIGKTFNIYSKGLTNYELSAERAELREKFELYSTGGQSYRVTFKNSDPQIAFNVASLVLNRIRNYFINSRLETIEIAKKIILKRLESATVTRQISASDISSNALASKNESLLKSQLSRIDNDINALKMQFNTNHPRIIKLNHKRATIANWLKESSETIEKNQKMVALESKEFSDAPIVGMNDSDLSKNLTAKLFSKFNDINIALDIEKRSVSSYIAVIETPQLPTSPLFPKKSLFGATGLVIGIILSMLYLLFKDVLFLKAPEKSMVLAHEIEGEYLGFIPFVSELHLMNNKSLLVDSKKKDVLTVAVKRIENSL